MICFVFFRNKPAYKLFERALKETSLNFLLDIGKLELLVVDVGDL